MSRHPSALPRLSDEELAEAPPTFALLAKMGEGMLALDELEDLTGRLEAARDAAEAKAIDSLARYKFQMFGYWAAIWVDLNRIIGDRRPSPFRHIVKASRLEADFVLSVLEDPK